MQNIRLHTICAHEAVAAGQDSQPSITHWEMPIEQGPDWASGRLAPFITRRYVGAQSPLFEYGEPATGYYIVEAGKLLVRRRSVRSRAAIRFVTDSDLFIYDCDGVHVASCDAVVDSLVLRIDRRSFERQARLDPALQEMRMAVHANELEFLLQSLGPGPRTELTCADGRSSEEPMRSLAIVPQPVTALSGVRHAAIGFASQHHNREMPRGELTGQSRILEQFLTSRTMPLGDREIDRRHGP